MCGLFGWILPSSKRLDQDILVNLTDRLAHRGPDGSGNFLCDTRDGAFQVGLGHRRLSIIDIAGGVQPMWNRGRTLLLIFNGEIYNYIELREELKAFGHIFETQSDTEVLLEAYERWGVDALPRLRGMFAFAIWDIARQKLVLARDAFGKKPLFLAEQDGRLIFSSEIEPLTCFPGLDRGIDVEALDHYLLNRYVPGPLTFFRSIRKLQPGCHAVWEAGQLSIRRYFVPPFATVSPDVTRMEHAVALFREAFDESVHIRMRSDAPYGAYLSGGIDSSAVVGAMVRHSSGPVRTFSVGFCETSYSELDHARTVGAFFGTDHHELVVTPDDFFAHWPQAIVHRGAPVSEASDSPILMLSKEASRTVKMVLTGEGADELLGGYPKHRAEQWVGLYQRLVPHRLHHGFVSPMLYALPYGMRRIKIAATAAGERDLADRMRVWFGGTSVDERDAMMGVHRSSAPPDGYPFSAKIGSSVRRTLFFDQTSWLPDNLLERGDRMMMAGSIEGRMPFMDTVLSGVVARFPDRFLVGQRGGKVVLRRVMQDVLPPAILNRKKVGFRVPFNAWFRGTLRDFTRDMLTSDASHVRRICDSTVVDRLVFEHLDGRQNNERMLWSLINLEMFLRAFELDGTEGIYRPTGTSAGWYSKMPSVPVRATAQSKLTQAGGATVTPVRHPD